MSTKSIVTGTDIALTIGSTVFKPQTLSVTLTSEADRQEYDLVNGNVAYKTILRSYELAITGLADWGHSNSVCEALEDAFDSDPDTSLSFSMPIVNSPNTVTVTGKVFPKVPVAGGTGAEVTQFDVTLVGDVNQALAFNQTVTPT
jgi:hypothetical protein